MVIRLMRMFMDGPEVSLKGSPTVSPTTAALWALGALAAVVAALDVLLRVVPGTAGVGHEDGHEHSRWPTAPASKPPSMAGFEAADDDGDDDGQDARQHHLLQGAVGGDGHALVVLGLGLVLHDALDLAELAANLFDHGVGRAGDGAHGKRGEHERHHGADEDARHDQRVGEGELEALEIAWCMVAW